MLSLTFMQKASFFAAGFLSVFFLFLPSSAFAFSHVYDCTAEFTPTGASCVGAGFQLQNGVNSRAVANSPTSPIDWQNGQTYYFVVSATGTTGTWIVLISDGVMNNTSSNQANTQTNGQFTMTPTMTGPATDFSVRGSLGTSNTDALVTSLCVSDTSYAECLGGGGGGSSTGFATSTPQPFGTTTSYSVVSNPNLELFLGMAFMSFWVWFVVWFYKIDRGTRK